MLAASAGLRDQNGRASVPRAATSRARAMYRCSGAAKVANSFISEIIWLAGFFAISAPARWSFADAISHVRTAVLQCRCRIIAIASGQLEEAIERQFAAAERDQREQEAGPAQMRRPGVGIDEDLNDRRHDE